MVELIQRLLDGATPTAPTMGPSSSASRRGRVRALARLDPEQLRVGERVEADEYGKDDVRDFALWKGPKEGEPSWDTRSDRQTRLAHRVLGDEHGRPGSVVRHPHAAAST
jgi:cysteinyl-tRNA synthetase